MTSSRARSVDGSSSAASSSCSSCCCRTPLRAPDRRLQEVRRAGGGRTRCAPSTIPASRGLILDRNGVPLVNNVTTVEIRLSREEAILNPTIKGSLASLTGQSIAQINADLNNQQYDPYQPAPILADAPANEVAVHQAAPRRVPGRVGARRLATFLSPRWQRRVPRSSATSARSTTTNWPRIPTTATKPIRRSAKTGIESFYEQYLRGHDGTSTIEVNSNGQVIGTLHTTQPQSRRFGRVEHRRRSAEGARRLPRERHRPRAQDSRPTLGRAAARDQRRRGRSRPQYGRRARDVELPVVQPHPRS